MHSNLDIPLAAIWLVVCVAAFVWAWKELRKGG